jgi:hypothetical protein
VTVATTLIEQFARMVGRDGGALTLLSDTPDAVRVGYRMGKAPACDGGACVLPHLELQDLMTETLRRRDPMRRVIVELLE